MEEDIYSQYSFLLDKTSRKVKQYAKKQFAENEFGITVDQWTVMKGVALKPGISQRELADLTFKGMPTLTHIIDLLEKKEMVQREPDVNDRRKTRVTLTPTGQKKVEDLIPRIQKIRQKAWQNLRPSDVKEFKRILNAIYQNLED